MWYTASGLLETQERERQTSKPSNKKAAPQGRLTTNRKSSLVAFVAGALPVDQLADGRAGTRHWLFVGFHFRAGRFFADGADAEADFLFFRTHLDDLELVLDARFKMQRLAIAVQGFGLVAQAFDALGDFDERTECGYAQNFSVDNVANMMSLEERLPDVGLKLLHAQRQPALVGFDG